MGISVDPSVPTVPPFITADAEPVPAVNANADRNATFDVTLCRMMFKFDGDSSGAALRMLSGSFDKYAELAKDPVETPARTWPLADC